MEAQHIVEVFTEVAATIGARIEQLDDWGPSGTRPGQYLIDVAADEVAVAMLGDSGFGVLSEESGVSYAERPLLAVVDPIDGSTNAAAGLPWFATSICAVDDQGPLASVVVNQATGDRWHAMRGGGAFRNDRPIGPSRVIHLADAFVAVSGLPNRHFGWRQFRCFGASALDICSVADGTFDAFVDLSIDAHGAWDYLGALLVCREAGASMADARGRELVVRRHSDRRTPVAAATPGLLTAVIEGGWADRPPPPNPC